VTRRVLVSNRLPELRSGNAVLDQWVAQHLQRYVAEVFEQIGFLTPESGDWTPSIRGSGTAGTYELAEAFGRYYKIGDFVFANFGVRLAGSVTGGGTDNLQILGLPFEKVAYENDGYFPTGDAWLSDVDTSTCVNVSVGFESHQSAGSILYIHQTMDNAAYQILPISAVAASDYLMGSIAFEAGDRAA
jgi:hypothetical protein